MNKFISILVLVLFCETACKNSKQNETVEAVAGSPSLDIQAITNDFLNGTALFDVELVEDTSGIVMPAIQSNVYASYQGEWVFLGGQRHGFHGTTSSPAPFKRDVANDSIYVLNIATNQTWGVPVPVPFKTLIGATNQQSCSIGDNLYVCGGYTVDQNLSPQFNWTSDHFFEINLPNLIAYVKSGGSSPDFNQVITLNIQNPFVQVTGGEMMVVNDIFYLIGGQNFSGIYSAGSTGDYTNAIRKFKLNNTTPKAIIDTASVIDINNLHRRDLNTVKMLAAGDDSIRAVMYGGVFTPTEYAYLNPVMISGLSDGVPQFQIDTMIQKVNQYNCASFVMSYRSPYGAINITTLIGGITGMLYDTVSNKLVYGFEGDTLPFSNLVTSLLSDGANFSLEAVQTPPGSQLPTYIGSNATFIPAQNMLLDGYDDILDLEKIVQNSGSRVLLGYMAGGIRSDGPTSGVTVGGIVYTYANPKIYHVYLNLN